MRYEFEIGRPRREQRNSPKDIEYSRTVGSELVDQLRDIPSVEGTLSYDEDKRGWKFFSGYALLWSIRALTPTNHCWHEAIHLSLSIDWHLAPTFLPVLVSFAVRRGLILRDKQKPDGLLWHPDMHSHMEKFQCRERAAQLTQAIQRKVRGIRALMKMADWLEYRDYGSTARAHGYAAYAVILTKRRFEATLEERILEFHNTLRSLLLPDEELEYSDRGFWVRSYTKGWSIYFCIEAYGHNPTMTAHMDAKDSRFTKESGALTLEPLRRPGTQRLLKSARELCPEKQEDSPIMRRMGLFNIVRWYGEPGERLAHSVKLEKRMQDINLRLYYDVAGKHGGAILEFVDIEEDSFGYIFNDTGALYLGEDEFAFIHPAIAKGVSGDIEYYSLLNMISPRQCRLIVNELKRIAWLISHEPASEEVIRYLERKPLYIFASVSEKEDFSAFDITPQSFLGKYRKRFLNFLGFVIEWFSERDRRCGINRAVNLVGL